MSAALPTVGLLTPNGRVGSAVLAELIKAHEAGKINVVVLHRPGSGPKATLPSTISARAIDVTGAVDAMVPALKGINTLVSALPAQLLGNELQLVEAFSKTEEHVTYIPALYGHHGEKEELAANPALAQGHQFMMGGINKAKELGVGLTTIRAGIFDEYEFAFGLTGLSVKENKVQANAEQIKRPLPIVTIPYLGTGIAEIVSRPAESIKDKEFAVIEYWATGQQLIDALTEVNGSKPTVIDYTQEDREKEMATPPYGPTAAAYKAAWAKGKWNYPGEIETEGFISKPLTEVMAVYK